MNPLVGQKIATRLLNKDILEAGRTFLLKGPLSSGKFSSAFEFSKSVLEKNPFFSDNFFFYQNDNWNLKTAFYLENYTLYPDLASFYFQKLLSRFLVSLSFNEQKVSNSFQDTAKELLNTNSFNNKEFQKYLLEISNLLEKKKVISIDVIRYLEEFFYTNHAQKKIVLLGNFEQATTEAQNASLKLFEEIGNKEFIFLTSNNINSILKTIRSRCFLIPFKDLDSSEISNIFTPTKETSIYNFMQENLFSYSKNTQNLLQEFFEIVVPRMSYSNSLFSFLEKLEEQNTAIHFCDALILWFEGNIAKRELSIHQKPSLDKKPSTLPDIHKVTYVSELEYYANLIIQNKKDIITFHLKAPIFLADTILQICRWYHRCLQLM